MQLALKPRLGYLTLLGAAAALIGGVSLVKIYFYRKRVQKRKSYPKDVVILHQFAIKGLRVPSLSPFALKLETWLRMADIKYQNEFTYFERSPQGQVPWITLNGEDIPDSQFCIEYLTKKYGKDLDDHLTQIEKAISRSFFKMIEESLRWVVSYGAMQGKSQDVGLPYFIFFLAQRRYKKALFIQGYGRHTKEQIYDIGRADLKAIDDFLGSRKFLFGETPSVVDAVIFAFTSQIFFQNRGPLNEFLTTKCTNVVRHLKTIKETYWSDWNDRVIEKS